MALKTVVTKMKRMVMAMTILAGSPSRINAVLNGSVC